MGILIRMLRNWKENKFFKLYLKYKKVLFASPRDFIYVKHFKQINEYPLTFGDCSISIEDENFPIQKGVERATMILTGNII